MSKTIDFKLQYDLENYNQLKKGSLSDEKATLLNIKVVD